MNIGKMREQVTCYAYVTEADEHGGFRATREESFTDWAHVVRDSSEKSANDGRAVNNIRYSITMRSRVDWSQSVDGDDFPSDIFKIVYRGRDLVLDGKPLESDDRMFVTFNCVEQQA